MSTKEIFLTIRLFLGIGPCNKAGPKMIRQKTISLCVTPEAIKAFSQNPIMAG